MADRALSEYIMVSEDALSPAQCQSLVDRFEGSADHEACRREAGHSFTQVDVTRCWPDQHQMLVPIFLSCFNKYQIALNARFWPPQFSFEHLRVKRYLPNGRDSFPVHVDVMGQAAARRFMTAMVYLNAPDGGETVFPDLDIRVAPRSGKLLAFPPLWPFPHEGLPPRSSAKYILHTYLCYPA